MEVIEEYPLLLCLSTEPNLEIISKDFIFKVIEREFYYVPFLQNKFITEFEEVIIEDPEIGVWIVGEVLDDSERRQEIFVQE